MNTVKSALLGKGGVPTPEQLAKINLQSKAELKAEQVYCFSVRLCDDQPDRDFERFDTAALPVLAELFIGKTGICDHQWSADRQVARIFDTQVVREDDGASFRALKQQMRKMLLRVNLKIRRKPFLLRLSKFFGESFYSIFYVFSLLAHWSLILIQTLHWRLKAMATSPSHHLHCCMKKRVLHSQLV